MRSLLRLAGTELKLFVREPMVLTFVFAFPVLTVLILGGVFDDADLDGGSRREAVLGLDVASPASPWAFGITWTRARQFASPTQTLLRGGVPVGTVRQPRIEIDDVMLRARRAF